MLLGWNMMGFVRFTHISALLDIFKCNCSFKTVCIFNPPSISVVYWCFLLSGREEARQSFIFLSSGNHPAVLYGNITSTPAVVPAGPVRAIGGRQRGLSLQRGQSWDGRLGTILSRRHGGNEPVSGCRQSPGFPAGRGVGWAYRETTSPHDADGRSDRNYISATGNDWASSCLAKSLVLSGAPCCLNELLSRKLPLCVDDPRRSHMLRFLGECIICFSLLLFIFINDCVSERKLNLTHHECVKRKTSKNVQRDIFWRDLIERGKPLLTS